MATEKEEELKLPPHHEQLPLCTTRPAYRQGRKLTAVKGYSVAGESNHLLIFGVPSVSLRREAKQLFLQFGELLQFHITTDHPAEAFTETYHACFQRIQSARVAKKMLDATNFYGGSLHVSYAPELETIQETRAKLLQRKRDVSYRLKNLQKASSEPNHGGNPGLGDNNGVGFNLNVNNEVGFNLNVNIKDSVPKSQNNEIVNEVPNEADSNERRKLNMGENNVIYVHGGKRKLNKKGKTGKRSKPSFNAKDDRSSEEIIIKNSLDIVDCTSTDRSVVSNINEALNYNKFGNEVIKKVDLKPMNKIVFNFNKKT